MHISTQGLVLREVNYKESDKLLTVLTLSLIHISEPTRRS